MRLNYTKQLELNCSFMGILGKGPLPIAQNDISKVIGLVTKFLQSVR